MWPGLKRQRIETMNSVKNKHSSRKCVYCVSILLRQANVCATAYPSRRASFTAPTTFKAAEGPMKMPSWFCRKYAISTVSRSLHWNAPSTRALAKLAVNRPIPMPSATEPPCDRGRTVIVDPSASVSCDPNHCHGHATHTFSSSASSTRKQTKTNYPHKRAVPRNRVCLHLDAHLLTPGLFPNDDGAVKPRAVGINKVSLDVRVFLLQVV